jgi:hypothetical protein
MTGDGSDAADANELSIEGDPSETPAPLGSVILTWLLSAAPDEAWIRDFASTNVAYSGPGVLDFQNIVHPEIDGARVRWRVPANLKEQAQGYIQQRIDRANSMNASRQSGD